MKTILHWMTTLQMKKNREIEIKLALDYQSYQNITERYKKAPLVCQINTFFDDAKSTLRNERWALRLREEDGIYFLTAKGPAEILDGIYDRPEYECEIEKELAEKLLIGFQLQNLLEFPAKFLCQKFGDLSLFPFFSFKNKRRRFKVFEKWVCELDLCESSGETRYELEIECRSGEEELLKQNLKNWFQENQWEYQNSQIGKLAWALQVANLDKIDKK